MRKFVYQINKRKQVAVTILLLVSTIQFGRAQDTLFTDTCDSETGWTLEQSGTTDYIKWRVNNECSLDGGALAINAWDNTTSTWLCEYWWHQAVSEIVAHKTVNASTAHSLLLKFDWECAGELFGSTVYDYGQVGYSTDAGSTFTWFDIGGKSNGFYVDQAAPVIGETLALPASLNNTSFELGFRWSNDASAGTDPAFIIDNIYVTGFTTTLVQSTYDFEADDGGYTHEATQGTDEWEWGTPSGQGPGGAHGGVKCWGTDLNNTYNSSTNEILYTPSLIVQSTFVILNYWHWHDTEFGYDTGIPEYRVNGGSWTSIPPVFFDGASNGWEERSNRIEGLTAGDDIEFRWTLNSDGSAQEAGWYIDDVSIINAITLDNNSTVAVGVGSEPATISSIVDTEGERIVVFDVDLSDLGSGDATASIIDQIVFTQGSANAIADWTDAIEGAKLSGPDLGTEATGTVSATGITFSGSSFISIADNTTETYQLKIWLYWDLSAVDDNDVLEFKLDYTDVTTDPTGSSFGSGSPESGDANVAIDIVRFRLRLEPGLPPSSVLVNQDFSVNVFATDNNGNKDLDATDMVYLSKFTGSGILSSVTGLSHALVNGSYTWTDVQYDTQEDFKIRVVSEAMIPVASSTISAVGVKVFDFETSAENFLESSTGNDLWEWGTPDVAGLTTGHNGSTYCAGIDQDGTYEANSTYILYTPELVALGSTVDFESWNWYKTEAGDDICSPQYQVNGGTWTTITSGVVSGTSSGWELMQDEITGLTLGDIIQLRWMLVTDQNQHKEGWYVDDVQVTNVELQIEIAAEVTSANCSDQNLGLIDITVTEGKAPYTYVWSNGPTTEDNLDLVAGDYTVTVTDINGIFKTQSFTINNTPKWDYLTGITPGGAGQLIKNAGLASSGTNSWANSWNELIGDGSVSFTIANTTDEFIIGLSTTKHTEGSYYAIEYALERDLDEVYISIGGSFPELTTFEVGDVFTIERVGSTISFYVNDIAFTHTETLASSTPLYVEASIETQDGVIDEIEVDFCGPFTATYELTHDDCSQSGSITINARGGLLPYAYIWSNGAGNVSTTTGLSVGSYDVTVQDDGNEQEVFNLEVGNALNWTSLTGIQIGSNSSLQKTAVTGLTNSGIASVNKFRKYSYFTFSAEQYSSEFIIGLSGFDHGSANYRDIDFAIELRGQQMYIYEGATEKYSSSYNEGDVFKIEWFGDNINYYINSTAASYSSSTGGFSELLIEASINNQNGEITNVYGSTCSAYADFSGNLGNTIGGAAGFASISQALAILNGKRISDDVLFFIKEGVYNEKIDFGSNLNYTKSSDNIGIYIVPDTIDTGQIVISSPGEVVNIVYKDNISFYGLTLKAATNGKAVDASNSSNLNFYNLELNSIGTSDVGMNFKGSDVINIKSIGVTGYTNGISLGDECSNITIQDADIVVANQAVDGTNPTTLKLINNNIQTTASQGIGSIHLAEVNDQFTFSGNTITGINKIIDIDLLNASADINGNAVVNSSDNAIHVKSYGSDLNIQGNSIISSGGSGIIVGDPVVGGSNSVIPDRILEISSNEITVSGSGIKVSNQSSSDIVILRNDLNGISRGIVLESLTLVDTSDTNIILLKGNLTFSETRCLEINNVLQPSVIRSNTFVADTSDTATVINLNNSDNLKFCANNAVNYLNADVVLFTGTTPSNISTNWNNWFSFTSSTISNNEALIFSGSDLKVDPKFDGDVLEVPGEEVYRLSYQSVLRDLPISCFNDTVDTQNIDLNGTIRLVQFDIGALESVKTAMDDLQIRFVLEDNIAFTAGGSGSYNSFEIQGLANYTTVQLDVYKRVFGGEELIYTSTSTSAFWDGIDMNTSQFVDQDAYKYILTLDSRSIGGFVYVRR